MNAPSILVSGLSILSCLIVAVHLAHVRRVKRRELLTLMTGSPWSEGPRE